MDVLTETVSNAFAHDDVSIARPLSSVVYVCTLHSLSLSPTYTVQYAILSAILSDMARVLYGRRSSTYRQTYKL